jgi:hypothetical protein
MQRFLEKLACLIFLLPLSILLFGCSAAQPTANPNLIWKVDLSKFDVKNKLKVSRRSPSMSDRPKWYIKSIQRMAMSS